MVFDEWSSIDDFSIDVLCNGFINTKKETNSRSWYFSVNNKQGDSFTKVKSAHIEVEGNTTIKIGDDSNIKLLIGDNTITISKDTIETSKELKDKTGTLDELRQDFKNLVSALGTNPTPTPMDGGASAFTAYTTSISTLTLNNS